MSDINLINDDFSKLEDILNEAQNDFAIDMDTFRKTKIFKMGKFIRIYSDLMKHLDVKVNEDVEEALGIQQDDGLIDTLNFKSRLDRFIKDWNDFLEKVEQNVSSSEQIDDGNFIQINEIVSQDLIKERENFYEIEKNLTPNKISLEGLSRKFLLNPQVLNEQKKSFMLFVMLRHFAWLPWRDHVKEIEKSLPEFFKLRTQIVIVSFGNKIGAHRWLNQNVSSSLLNMITDESRILYKLFNLKKSFLKVWNTETLIYYAEQLAFNRELPKAYQDIEDDPHQLGGNFIFEIKNDGQNSVFKIVYIYRSKNPPDRPSIKTMLQFLNTQFEDTQ